MSNEITKQTSGRVVINGYEEIRQNGRLIMKINTQTKTIQVKQRGETYTVDLKKYLDNSGSG